MKFSIVPPEQPHVPYDSDENVRQLQMYNPHLDCEVLRAHPETFEQLRSEYHLRRE